MKSIKKLATLSLSAVVTTGVLFTGCSSKTPVPEASTPTETVSNEKEQVEGTTTEETTPGKLIIFQSKAEIMNQLNECAEAFSEETGIEVEVWETSGDSYFTDLKTDISTGAGPTLFSLAPGSETVEMSDYLDDLGDLSFINDISKGMADKVSDKIVGIPYTLEGFGLVYDSNLVDINTLTSTDALVSYLEQSKAKGINGLGLSQEDYFLIVHILNTPFAVQSDPNAYLEQVLKGEVKMYDSDAFKEFASIMEAIRTNCTNPVDITYDNNCGDFATGKTGMIHQGNWCYSMFADYDINFDLGLAALPIVNNNKIAVSVPAAWYVNTDAPAEDKAAAKQFLEWLYTSETGASYLMDQFGFIPVVTGMTSNTLDPISQSVAEAAAQGNTIPWSMSKWPAGIASTLAPITQEFFTSDMTGEEFVNLLNDAFVAAAK